MTTAMGPVYEAGWVPDGDFSDRLALVRSRMGWNYSEAGDAVQVDGEAWARWELEGSRPQDFEGTCKRVKDASGCNLVWLMTGQSGTGTTPPRRLKRRERRSNRVKYTAGDLNPEPAGKGLMPLLGFYRGIRREPKPRIIPGANPFTSPPLSNWDPGEGIAA